MSKPIKLLIAIPTLDYIHRKFVESLTGLVKYLESDGDKVVTDIARGFGDNEQKKLSFDVHFEGCTLVYISRDNIAKKAIEEDYTEVLWLDADMVFSRDIYWRLKKMGKDFAAGVYRGRHGSNKPCVFEKLEPPERWDDFDDYKPSLVLPTPKEIKGCGFGCVLTSTDILRTVWNRFGTCFRPTPLLGEDLAFCKRVSDCGFPMYANLGAKVGHIGQYIINCDENENGSILTLI